MGRQRLVGLGLGDSSLRLCTVYALAVSGTNLYAGGWFTTAGGVPANYIAKWDGSAWSALGSGMEQRGRCAGGERDRSLRRRTVHHGGRGAGQLHRQMGRQRLVGLGLGDEQLRRCAGGERDQSLRRGIFTKAGGVTANNIAKWDGSAWSALGSGISGTIRGLCVGGERDQSLRRGSVHHGGRGAGQLHRQMGRQRLVGLGLGGEGGASSVVDALAADGVDHLFVGGNFSMAGTNVSPYIAQANLASVPTILMPPQTQTAEAGATVLFRGGGHRRTTTGLPMVPERHQYAQLRQQ